MLDPVLVYVSTDGGATWQTRTLPEKGKAQVIAVHPSNEQIVYIGGIQTGRGAVCRSSDGGATWTRLGQGVYAGAVVALAVDPLTAARIYAASEDGVFRSEDSAATWTRCLDRAATALAVDPSLPGRVYAAGSDGVWKSSDFGGTWTDFNRGLSVKAVSALRVVKATGTLVASTLGGSIYQVRPGSHRVLVLSASPGGTTAPAPGTYKHTPGTVVTIAAAPDPDHTFAGWSGDASGTVNPLSVKVDRDLAVRAEFAPILFAPLDFAGTKKVNRSLMFVEYVNVLTWRRNPANPAASAYRLYEVDGSIQRPLGSLDPAANEFRVRGVAKDKSYTYRLAAVDPATGREGPPTETTVR